MEIQSLIGINGYTLMVYWSAKTEFRFEVIDSAGKYYVCPSNFSCVDNAESKAFSVIAQLSSN